MSEYSGFCGRCIRGETSGKPGKNRGIFSSEKNAGKPGYYFWMPPESANALCCRRSDPCGRAPFLFHDMFTLLLFLYFFYF